MKKIDSLKITNKHDFPVVVLVYAVSFLVVSMGFLIIAVAFSIFKTFAYIDKNLIIRIVKMFSKY